MAKMFDTGECSAMVWEQLLRLAESGDLRAIKLYYEMLEKQQRQQKAACTDADREMEQMAEIRRAVFGDGAITGHSSDTDGDDEADDLL